MNTLRYIDEIGIEWLVNTDHILRVVFSKGTTSDGFHVATILLTNTERVIVQDKSRDRLEALVHGGEQGARNYDYTLQAGKGINDALARGEEPGGYSIESDRYIILLHCGHWITAVAPGTEPEGFWWCQTDPELHGLQPAAREADTGREAVIAMWETRS